MLAKIKSATYLGIEGVIVDVEVDLSQGIPSFSLVGLPETVVKESKERVITAIRNSNFSLPLKKMTINLAPADLKKEGAGLDLPIALGILCASGYIHKDAFNNRVFLGELSLDGHLRGTRGILPITISLKEKGIREIFVPEENSLESGLVDGIDVYSVHSLREVVGMLNGEIKKEKVVVNKEEIFRYSSFDAVDFYDVKGQFSAKRALEIASAGAHNILFIGPPGSGKTMLARRLPTIMPAMTFEEALEVTKVHSVAGVIPRDKPLVAHRPFRSPHHTISDVGLIGGGQIPKPGEVSLAHNGVLFLDEMPEFSRGVLEVLRQPLEDGFVRIGRAKMSIVYPARFMLVGAMNPCPCGYLTDSRKECTCSAAQIRKYVSRISGPLLDRIDIHIDVPPIEFTHLSSKEKGESSSKIRERVERARKIQLERFKQEKEIYFNSHMNTKLVKKYCSLSQDSETLLKNAMEKLGLSARAYTRILKVARTIADLEEKENIESYHIAEAIQYRTLDREYWLSI